MLQLIRTSPGLLITLALLLGGALVCLLIGFLMARAGASLRPVWWFGGFFALVIGPQLAGHLWMALRTAPSQGSTAAAPATTPDATAPEERAGNARSPFGPDVDPTLVMDARGTFEAIGSPAQSAQFAVLPDSGESVLLGYFASAAQAEKAWVSYLRSSGLGQLGGTGDSHRGYAVTRPAGDRAFAIPIGPMLGVWTGPTDAAIQARMEAGGFSAAARTAVLAGATATGAGRSATAAQPRPPLAMLLPALAMYVLLVVLYFFKGAAWAGSTPAVPGVAAVPAATLAARLESINTLDVPFAITRGDRDNEWIATWRYADAKWIDLARAHGLRRTFSIRMTLDERSRTVRATDYVASYDWSAGPGGASITWKSGLGIVFFQREHTRVLGLQLDEQGRFKPEFSYAYSFNLDELKEPLRTAVARSGWKWRPTVWQGPTWLRWLTT